MNSISVDKLGKRYRVYFEKPALIKSILPFLVTQGKVQQFWALRDVSFDIKKGECIGIVGPNGSGKSTILSILSGVTAPTEGTVKIDGRISSLLTLGAGFNFELTGQENVYLNSAILGLSKTQVDGIYDKIVDFADLGKFMNAKLATYSSGMNMRLGFAIASVVPFDVLLIDEILAVGDMEFQIKSLNTMRKFYEDEGKTIIFVSHSLGNIEELCGRVMWFEHGRIEEFDDTDKVLSKYRDRYREKYSHTTLKIGAIGQSFLKQDLKLARIEVDAGKVLRRIPKMLFGCNLDWINDGNVLCNREQKCISQDLARFLKPYGFTSFRYPGTMQTDHFHWHEAVGSERKRQRPGYPENPKSYPYFGPDEYMAFCNMMDSEPFISLNLGTGTEEEAAGWLEHCMRKGMDVSYWELGDELYYDEYHPLGVAFPFSAEEYGEKAASYARRLRSIEPGIKVGAIGCCDSGVFKRYSHEDWNRVVLEKVGDNIDFFSVHNASAPVLNITPEYGTPDLGASYIALMAAPQYVEENIRRIKSDLKRYGRDGIKLAVSDYRVLFDFIPGILHESHHVKGRLGTDENWRQNKTLGAALYEAMLLNIFARDPDIVLAHRFSLFHKLFSALFDPSATSTLYHPQAHMFKLYAKLADKLLVFSSAVSGSFSSEAVGIIPPQKDVPFLDVIAARDEDNTKLSLFVVNRNLFRDVNAEVRLKGYEPAQVVVKHLRGPTFESSNHFHEPWLVDLLEQTKSITEVTDYNTGRLCFSFPKHSLTVLYFSKEEWF